MAAFTISAAQAVLPGKDETGPVTVTVDNGKVTAVSEGVTAGADVVVPEGKVLLPGLIDCHVHLNQPGRTAWEGFATGTAAAVAGGVTTLVDMPLNSIPPTTTMEGLAEKRAAALATGVKCDVGFWGGIIPGNADQLVPLLDAGVKGFKCFLMNSGVEEFPMVQEEDLIIACDTLAKDGRDTLVLFHAEIKPSDHTPATDPNHYATFLHSRPQDYEINAIELILRLARKYPTLRFHIVHLSAADAIPGILAARNGTDGLGAPITNLSIETCFHYMTLAAEDVPDCATHFKCCPPIRGDDNRKKIVDAVLDGTIEFVVSDHSPCTPELKKGDFISAWGGISGLGFGLPLLWTELRNRTSLANLVTLLGTRQAQQVGIEKRKGSIQVGGDADFVVFDPAAEYDLTLEHLFFKNKVSPYIGKRLTGRVDQTYLRGEVVYDADKGHLAVSGALL